MSVFHPDTEALIEHLRRESPQSLLLSGPFGVGLRAVAEAIAAGSEVTVVTPDDSKASRPITTETIRELYGSTRSKSLKRQYVIIDEAHAMTAGAQGAFLKLLEEPNVSIHFILTTSQPDILLPTIRSRVQQHQIPPITPEQSEAYVTSQGITDETRRRQLLYLAEGLPEELARLMADETYFEESAQRMKDARELLRASQYEKLVMINVYKDNRDKARQLLAAATRMTRRSVSEHPQKASIVQLEKLLAASKKLDANANVRLTLTQLVI
jgi:DNA polymerase-3 subunit delta'